ncbi:MAG: NUDIX domain-containing protein [Lachnospiraceae bacterium]|nr:NUDIX domain-containing protein [Lachnospiraceae bacterium]
MKREKSCGAVVFTRSGGQIRYVLVLQKKGFYNFPKGHVEGKETEAQTALREIREETGLRPRLITDFREVTEYYLPKRPDTLKTVVFFLAEYAGQPIIYQKEELLGAKLASYEEAQNLPMPAASREILTKAKEYIEKNLSE